jgi:cell division protein FtsQ
LGPEWADPVTVPGERMVLPRPLRRTARFIGSLAAGRIPIPNHVGSLALVAFYAVAGIYVFSLNGESRDVAQAVTSAAGFAINNVKVSGNAQTSEIDILERLGLDGTTSLMALDVADTRFKLKSLPWVLDAEVRKVYPDTVSIKLKEKTAFGIWQHGQDLSLIQEDGSVIAPLRDNKFAYLPLFVGSDAGAGAAEIMADFDQWPDVKKRVKAFVRVAGRRWDLKLDNGVIVKLPEHNMERAMADLSAFDRDQKMLERDIVAVDLRLEDRTTVQLTPDAAARREKLVSARAKEIKKEEKVL